MINLVIKGQPLDAIIAALDRKIDIECLRVTGYGETVANTPQENFAKIVAWFASDVGQAPYAAGSLLLFSTNDNA